jgi:hypothetical protein
MFQNFFKYRLSTIFLIKIFLKAFHSLTFRFVTNQPHFLYIFSQVLFLIQDEKVMQVNNNMFPFPDMGPITKNGTKRSLVSQLSELGNLMTAVTVSINAMEEDGNEKGEGEKEEEGEEEQEEEEFYEALSDTVSIHYTRTFFAYTVEKGFVVSRVCPVQGLSVQGSSVQGLSVYRYMQHNKKDCSETSTENITVRLNQAKIQNPVKIC